MFGQQAGSLEGKRPMVMPMVNSLTKGNQDRCHSLHLTSQTDPSDRTIDLQVGRKRAES